MSDQQYQEACGFIFRKSDLNKDEMVSFDEFTPMYLLVHPKTPFNRATKGQWTEMFDLYDSNGDALVSWTEAWRLFQYKERFDLMPAREKEPESTAKPKPATPVEPKDQPDV